MRMNMCMRQLLASVKINYSPYVVFTLATLIVLSGFRLIFAVFLHGDRVSAAGLTEFVLLQGLRFDLITIGLAISFPVLIGFFLSFHAKLWFYFQRLLVAYLSISFMLMVFVELSTPSFIDQFDVRPNILFVEYLKYPQEVMSTLVKGYGIDLISALLIVPSLSIGFLLLLRRFSVEGSPRAMFSMLIFPFAVIVLVFMIRSSLTHRPANPSLVAVSPDLLVNSLALNSTYSVLYALYSSLDDEKGVVNYGSMSPEEFLPIVREGTHHQKEAFFSDQIPTLHTEEISPSETKKLNLVIVLEESLGAEFVGALGGLPLTPNLDKLAQEGVWFDNMYATGTRSVRGIEAVVTGFPPTPARSVVKLQKSQSNFYTVAQSLKSYGYESSFVYGGGAHFDNMRSFFMGNGFDKVVEEKDYQNPSFKGSWGVSDEDLFSMAHQMFEEYDDKPFFSLVFTSSNHSPFEYPEGKIELHDEEFHTVNNAVKYADYALGGFIEKAKQSRYWDNTLFVIVADHNSRVYGDALVPIERFHIPCLVLGGPVTPMVYSRLASQIDLMPTLLPWMGIEEATPMIGVNLLDPDVKSSPGRAIMQFHQVQAYRQEDRVVILQPDKKAELFSYEAGQLAPMPLTQPDLVAKALAYANFGPYAYSNHLYTLPVPLEAVAKHDFK